jgi:4-amino-4-deoxychorismate lyase
VIGQRLVNGVESGAIATDDRGLQYGDGLFETMAAMDGRIRHFALHMARLEAGCGRLGIPMPLVALLEDECLQVLEGLGSGVVKLVITRGPGPRGYRPPQDPTVTRIVTASAMRSAPSATSEGIVARVCDTRLGLNPRLAGIKHLNRLEQVLACAEWDDPDIAEGLMLATDERLIGATAANLFLVRHGRLHTPEIRDCGVAGIMRQLVLAAAKSLDLGVEVGDLGLAELRAADEIFVTNAVTGIRPVIEVRGEGSWPAGEVTRALRARTEPGSLPT